MAEIHGGGTPPLSPENKKLYEKEYKQGVDLFQRALNEYSKADEMNKKQAFKEVMDRALQVLRETSHELHSPDLEKQTDKIQKDYQDFQEGESSKNLAKDLKEVRRFMNF
jgi:coenzyme F420-reducing hydrogenase alpha subunit